MARAKLAGTPEDLRLHFHCPGCDEAHLPRVGGVGSWTWNGRLDLPTLQPSVLVTSHVDKDDWTKKKEGRCHSHVTDGRIQFLTDCTHAMAGQTVDLPELRVMLEVET